MSKHQWKAWNGKREEMNTEHRVHFMEGNNNGLVPGLYCETHGRWIMVFYHDSIEVSGHSCVRRDTIKAPYQE